MRPVNATKHATRVSSTLALTIFSFCSLGSANLAPATATKQKIKQNKNIEKRNGK